VQTASRVYRQQQCMSGQAGFPVFHCPSPRCHYWFIDTDISQHKIDRSSHLQRIITPLYGCAPRSWIIAIRSDDVVQACVWLFDRQTLYSRPMLMAENHGNRLCIMRPHRSWKCTVPVGSTQQSSADSAQTTSETLDRGDTQWRHQGGGPPRVTPSRGNTRRKIFLWANLQRIVEKRGRTCKKGVGWHQS